MIRIGITGDSQLNEQKDLADNVRVHDAMHEAMVGAGVDLTIHTGDLHDKRSTPEVRNYTDDWLRRRAEHGPVVIVRGNHDVLGDLTGYANLGAKHPITVHEQAGHDMVELGDKGGVLVQALPWFDKGYLAARVRAREPSQEQVGDRLRAEVAHLLDVLANQAKIHLSGRDVPVIGAGHVMIGGSVVAEGQVLIGSTIELAVQDLLGSGALFWALGHVHRFQEFAGGRVFYAGSPQRHDMGEPEAKSWSLIVLEKAAGGTWSWTHACQPLPARRIVHLDADWSSIQSHQILQDNLELTDDMVPWEGEDLGGADVRLRYRIRAEDVELVSPTRIEEQILEAGARSVQVEPRVHHETRARAEQIVERQDPWEKVLDYFKVRKVKLGEDDLALLHDRFEEVLREEASDAA